MPYSWSKTTTKSLSTGRADGVSDRTAGRSTTSNTILPPEGGCGGDAEKPCEVIQRSDDTEEKLKARLAEFHTKAQPAIGYLAGEGIPLLKVPGNLPTFSRAAVRASVFSAMRIA